MVDLGGFEPPTSSMPWKRAPNCATGPFGVTEDIPRITRLKAVGIMGRLGAIAFDSVGYQVGGNTVLDGFSLLVERGETVALLGRSGSGKTTALRLVNALIEPTSGVVRVDGRSTAEWDRVRLRRSIGYVIQDAGLFPHYTVAENVGLVPRLEGLGVEWIDARVRELLTLVGLDAESLMERRPRQLSGGQRQRVGVARALAADPPTLLMDEPFGALDPMTRRGLQAELASLKGRLGKTILFVTHDVREALLLGDRIAVIEGGRVAWLGEPREFEAAESGPPAELREIGA